MRRDSENSMWSVKLRPRAFSHSHLRDSLKHYRSNKSLSKSQPHLGRKNSKRNSVYSKHHENRSSGTLFSRMKSGFGLSRDKKYRNWGFNGRYTINS
uniref:Ovule protein n=1 Tax=Strongyloides papillosus TaxID=174720 RepID=A0A0N5B6Z9_STREA